MHYAHTLPDHGPDAWEPLEVHLREVAALAEQHAAKFGSRPVGAAGWIVA
jgi:hypothetical protein